MTTKETHDDRAGDGTDAQDDRIAFTDLFNLNEIQTLQDAFSDAAGVASIITTPDGVPVTKPSNFRRLCSDIIRNTPKGFENCMQSDAFIGTHRHQVHQRLLAEHRQAARRMRS